MGPRGRQAILFIAARESTRKARGEKPANEVISLVILVDTRLRARRRYGARRMDDSIFGRTYRSTSLALMAAVGIAAYDSLSVSAALPDIGDRLGNVGLLPWVITVELLTSAVAILMAGPLIDGIGVSRTFKWSASGVIVASTFAAGAINMPMLIVARAGQGVAAGMVIAVSVAAAGIAYPARLRPRAFAATSSVWGVLGVGGPAIAAFLVSTTGWRGVLLINVPVAGFALWMGRKSLPGRQEQAVTAKFDTLGLALITALTAGALAATAGSLIAAMVGFAVVVASGIAYVRHTRTTAEPVVLLGHLSDRRFRYIHLTASAAMAGGLGINAFLPLYIRGARGQSMAVAAFSVLFLTVGWTGAAIVASRLQDRLSGEKVMLIGTLIVTPAAVLNTITIVYAASLPLIFATLIFVGAGIGIITNSGLAVLQSRARNAEMGRVGSAHQFVRTLAITYGTAVAGLIVFSVVGSRVASIEAVRNLLRGDQLLADRVAANALAAGYATATAVGAVVIALSIIPAIRLLRSSPST